MGTPKYSLLSYVSMSWKKKPIREDCTKGMAINERKTLNYNIFTGALGPLTVHLGAHSRALNCVTQWYMGKIVLELSS